MDGSFKVLLGFNKVFKGSALKNFSEAMEEGIVDPEKKAAEEERRCASRRRLVRGAVSRAPGKSPGNIMHHAATREGIERHSFL